MAKPFARNMGMVALEILLAELGSIRILDDRKAATSEWVKQWGRYTIEYYRDGGIHSLRGHDLGSLLLQALGVMTREESE